MPTTTETRPAALAGPSERHVRLLMAAASRTSAGCCRRGTKAMATKAAKARKTERGEFIGKTPRKMRLLRAVVDRKCALSLGPIPVLIDEPGMRTTGRRDAGEERQHLRVMPVAELVELARGPDGA